MDAKTIFTMASIMVLANGAILTAMGRELPANLRPAASHWCTGTLLVALGCVVFAFGEPLPRAVMLSLANAAFAFGLTAYFVAIRRFLQLEVKAWHVLPGIVATAAVLWFSAVEPNFQLRMAAVSLVWVGLMAMSVKDLTNRSRGHASLARSILAVLFTAVGLYSAARAIVYLFGDFPEDFAVEAGGNWLNVLSALLLTMLPVMGTTAFLLMCSDRLRRGLERAAATDYLTGLPNRRSLAQAGSDAFLEARAEAGAFALAVFDVDKFKAINDTYGHEAGDRALVQIANSLSGELRPGDMLARTGGEEFVVLFSETREADIPALAERMRAAVERADFRLDGRRVALTVSAGVAFAQPDDAGYDDVLRRADGVLYRAKSNGRNRVEIASSAATAGRMLIAAPPALAVEDCPAPGTDPKTGPAPAQISR
ncbi:GGDEF domain-containing protein [Shinella sp. G-2]|uniref:GGDEF domain-containing protein n=1 Tax=Shinella sp. G-2 TaxID=3133141 RepID=UPI003CFF3139